MQRLLFGAVLLLLAQFTNAQQGEIIKCYTDEVYETQVQQNPYREVLRQQTESIIEENIRQNPAQAESGAIRKIPVVFHVMYYNAEDNISMEQIEDGLEVLNLDWRRQNPDAGNVRPQFASVVADMEVEFELAKIDPNGNCTNGVTRQYSTRTLNANNQIKQEVNWPNNKYLNIWVVRNITLPGAPGTILGYAAFPYVGQPTTDDGIVIRHDALGRIGTATRIGRTLSHEAGHYLNLYHPFQGGCSGGDGCADTPPVDQPNYGCPTTHSSCGTLDMIENHMDYADDNCVNSFTQDQKSRVTAVLNSINLRGDVSSASNLIATGINGTPDCKPTALFDVDPEITCMNQPVTLTSGQYAYNNPTYSWSTPGGSQTGGTATDPEITYTAPGYHDIAHTITDSKGTSTVTKKKAVLVMPDYAVFKSNLSEGFEGSWPGTNWFTQHNLDTSKWKVTSDAAYSGSKSLRLNNYDNIGKNGLDAFFTMPIESQWMTNMSLTFKYAYTRPSASERDQLKIEVSNDCGQTWQLARTLSHYSLESATQTSSWFVPASKSDWKSATVSLNAFLNQGPILLRFCFVADGGNNIYIDDINLALTLNEEENILGTTDQVYPNPNNGNFTWVIESNDAFTADIEILDLSGKQVAKPFNGASKIQPGINTLMIETNLPKGMYMLRMVSSKGIIVKRISIQ